ncbi:MAG: hypothetical protein LUG50_09865, partial [Planctomycetaceae bacterium]|nr:hypothetical protein [Planctomycetaceae bacterium]
KPSTVWGSRVGAHRNFNRNQTTDDDGNNIGAISDTSSFEHTLQADDSNEILWIVPMSDLLIGTTGGEFRMSSNGFIITPTNVSAKRQSNYGCSAITPVLVGQAVMGVGHKNRVLRAYKWDYSGDAYRGSNVSHYAGHLFNGRKIVDIAHQYEPESILWVVMSDGALLSMTYMDEEQVLGWSRNDTDGRFEACVTNIAADGSDEIWFIVAREVKGKTVRYIERMKNVMYDGEDIRNAWYLDSALEYRGTPTEVLRGLAHLEGKTVSCFADGAVHADLKVMNGAVTLTEKVSRAVVGLPFTAELETMDLEPIQGGMIGQANKRPVAASILFYCTRECFYGSKERPMEMKFRDERPGESFAAKTIRKTEMIPAPAGGESARVWLMSRNPVPFGILSMAVEMEVGEMAPRPGRAKNA